VKELVERSRQLGREKRTPFKKRRNVKVFTRMRSGIGTPGTVVRQGEREGENRSAGADRTR